MPCDAELFSFESESLFLRASLVPWDSEVLHFPVAHIEKIKISSRKNLKDHFKRFTTWRNDKKCRMVSARLHHNQLVESMFLENNGFKFIDVILHPKLEKLQSLDIPDQGLKIQTFSPNDMPEVRNIAESAFHFERFHTDPRIGAKFGNLRYGRWVDNLPSVPKQEIVTIWYNNLLLAFFVFEKKDSDSIYWHLTAVAPEQQGKGLGRRAWLAMLAYHKKQGCNVVSTAISSQNIRVLNLYASLNFRFQTSEMTLHWMGKLL